MALEGTSVREPLRHPAATLGILESGNLDGTCEPVGSCLKICQLPTQWRFPHWGVGDDLESPGNPPKCSERRRGLDLPLGIGSQGSVWLLLRHTDELSKSEIPTIKQKIVKKFLRALGECKGK